MMGSGTPDAYFFGDYVTNNVFNLGVYDGATQAVTTLTPSGLDGGDDLNSMAISSDGSQLALAGVHMAADPSILNVYATSDFSTATTLASAANATNTGATIRELKISPDGMWVAFTADFDLAGADAAYVVPTDGTAAPKQVSPTPPANGDVKELVWAANSQDLVYAGDVVTDNIDGIWSVDTAAATPTAVELVPAAMLNASQDVSTTIIQIDALAKVYFTADIDIDSLFRLYRVDLDGNNLEQVPGTGLTNGGGETGVGTWAISPDGLRLAFSSMSPDADLSQVYTMDIANPGGVAAVSAVQTAPISGETRGPEFFQPISWSPDQTMLAVAADWEVMTGDLDNEAGLFILPASGTAGGVRITKPATTDANQDAYSGVFATDGSRVFIHGDLVGANEDDVCVTTDFTTADQDATTLSVVAAPNNGDVRELLVVP